MRLLVAGGGTGGHLFPGVAVVEEIKKQHPTSEVLFVGTERGIEARVLPELGLPLELINVRGIKTKGILGKLKGMFSVPGSLWQSRKIIKRFKPDAVLGVGGYASGPVVLMARLMGVRSAIIEQNSIPGLANKILGKFVHRIFLSFEITRKFFKAKKIEMVGNPIRADIRAALGAAKEVESSSPRIFIFGGSQGAKAVNEVCADALALLAERGIKPSVVHQTGKANLEEIQGRYEKAGLEIDCRDFIRDMAAEYRRADLVIARSGATTVAELGVVGKPAILVPYPHAADNHQEENARELAEAGAALLLRQDKLSPETLAETLETLFADPAQLRSMAEAMKTLGRPNAATDVAHWLAAELKT